MTNHRHAFTLIELLIVVAIIAILAAIAVPNFLEAQTRSKVSRAKADIRTLATAIESYFVDYNRYPLSADEEGNPILPYPATKQAAGPEVFETRLGNGVTTPVAYITSLPNEPFPARSTATEDPRYHYGTRDYALAHGGPEEAEELDEYIEILTGQKIPSVRYFLLSHGPDRDHDGPGHHDHQKDEEEEGSPALYDPTNGTISNGDVVYLGPGSGFRN